jgi:hypothetical protein
MKLLRDLNEMAAELGRVGGWAPGNYMGKCGKCGREFEGDKRASQCLPCAVSTLDKRATEFFEALRKINRLNDHPGYFNAEVQKVLDATIDTRDVVFPTPAKPD